MNIAVLDTDVLAPPRLRDVLLTLAKAGLFEPIWSDRILVELERTLQQPRFGFPDFARLLQSLDTHFSAAKLIVDQNLEATCVLPDIDDRHVLAAAMQSGAAVIVTRNIRHFPTRTLAPFGMLAMRPDPFLTALLRDEPTRATIALRNRAAELTRPPQSVEDMIDGLRIHAPTFVSEAKAIVAAQNSQFKNPIEPGDPARC